MKSSIIIVLAIVAFVFLVRSTPAGIDRQASGNQDTSGFYPASVKKIIDDKCYGCHSIKGKSQKAKDKLMWDSLPGLRKSKIVASLNDIIEQLDKNEMPPPEFIKKMPDAALLTMDRATLKAWAELKADSLLK